MSTTTPEYRGCTKFHYEMYHYRRRERLLPRRPCTTTSTTCRVRLPSLGFDKTPCNTPHVTCHICNSDSCHFRLCVMIFPPLSGFVFRFCILFMSCISCHVIKCIAFAYVFVSWIRAFSPLSVLQSGAPISSGARLLFSFVCVCQTFSEWTEACQVALLHHPETTGQVSFHSEVVWYSNG